MPAKSISGFGKIGNILGSIRFWTITLSTTAWAISHPDRIPEAISAWLAAVAAVGTADSVAKLSARPTLVPTTTAKRK